MIVNRPRRPVPCLRGGEQQRRFARRHLNLSSPIRNTRSEQRARCRDALVGAACANLFIESSRAARAGPESRWSRGLGRRSARGLAEGNDPVFEAADCRCSGL